MSMVELFEKYLSQIGKKLKRQSVAKDFIDEFLENMSDQLYSMLEELMIQEPELDRSDAIISVISSCDSVDDVVSQVVEQYRSKEGVPRIDSIDSLERLKFLTPVESRLVSLSRRINTGLNSLNQMYLKWSSWYSQHERASLTAITYLAAYAGLICLLILVNILVPLNYVTVFPENISFFHIGDAIDVSGRFPTATSYQVTPVLPIVLSLFSTLVTFYIIGRIAWRYPIKNAAATIVVFSLSISLASVILSQLNRLGPIISQVAYDATWTAFTGDWYSVTPITVPDYVTFFNASVYLGSIPYVLLPSLGIGLLSNALKKLVNKELKKPFVFSSFRIIAQLLVAMLFISSLVVFSSSPGRFHESADIPLPDQDIPLIYVFDLNWNSVYTSINGSQEYTTVLPQFGNLGFDLYGLYHLVNLQNTTGLHSSGNLSILYDREESFSSLNQFNLLGLLYLPDIEADGGWQSLVGNEINSSYPFNGFTPSVGMTQNTLSWHVNGEDVDISVNTIVYSSNTNDSEYIFQFDSNHGWLMKAQLTLDSGSWAQGLELDTLTILRTFSAQPLQPSDLEPFYVIDTLLILPIAGVLLLIFLVDGIKFLRSGKEASVGQ